MTPKKGYGYQLGPMTLFWQHKIWPNFICTGDMSSYTFAKLPVHALINELKKVPKKVLHYHSPMIWGILKHVDLTEIGLQLNDPIDWFKLRLNQPKRFYCSISKINSTGLAGVLNRLHCWLASSPGDRTFHQSFWWKGFCHIYLVSHWHVTHEHYGGMQRRLSIFQN